MLRGLKSLIRRAGPSRSINGILPFYLALGYLIWSILPHAAFRVHEHAGGSAAHTHLSFHDAGLQAGSVVTANPSEWAQESPESEPETESAFATAMAGIAAEPLETFEPLELPRLIQSRAAHPQAFKPENPRHGHFTEDDNILAAGISVARTLFPIPHPVSVPAPVLSPSLPYSGPATARGPPSRA